MGEELDGEASGLFLDMFLSAAFLSQLFTPNSSLGEKIKGAYMPSWVLLDMTVVEERVRKRTTRL
jgi:hypothetical protein